MKQASSILSTYASDVSGVCSALYELGGMSIMDDASGCNSTYNTHDEPRWYSMPSMVYVSALTEMQAVLGQDKYLEDEICSAAKELHPRFIAIAGTPIPMMMGTDFTGIARVIEKRSGIPTMGFATNGMRSYIVGSSMALVELAKRFCPQSELEKNYAAKNKSKKTRVNLLGVTPLDFSVVGNVEKLKSLLEENNCEVISTWAMGSTFEDLMNSYKADVNVVASSCGLELAKYFEGIYGTPYITGIPSGNAATKAFFDSLQKAFTTKKTQKPIWLQDKSVELEKSVSKKQYIVGEAVWASSMALTLRKDFGLSNLEVLCPTETTEEFLGIKGRITFYEDDYFDLLKKADLVIADPIYKYAVPSTTKFISLPHEGYSGRTYRKDIPVVMGDEFQQFYKIC